MKCSLENKQICEQQAEVLKALAHPIRLLIVHRLIDKGCCNVNTMREFLNLPQSTVSQYLSKLRGVGIITADRNGTAVSYCIASDNVKELIATIWK